MDNAFSVVLLSFALYYFVSVFRRSKLPPGPRGLPFFGNEFQIPKSKQWLYFDGLRKQYGMNLTSVLNEATDSNIFSLGDIVYLRVLGQHTIVLGSAEAAVELLETRG